MLYGNIVRASTESADESVLMIFIRPTIIRDVETANGVCQQQFNYLRRHELNTEESSIKTRLDEISTPADIGVVPPGKAAAEAESGSEQE